jgi:hypothetical protein
MIHSKSIEPPIMVFLLRDTTLRNANHPVFWTSWDGVEWIDEMVDVLTRISETWWGRARPH